MAIAEFNYKRPDLPHNVMEAVRDFEGAILRCALAMAVTSPLDAAAQAVWSRRASRASPADIIRRHVVPRHRPPDMPLVPIAVERH